MLETLQFEIATKDRCRSLAQLYSALFQPIEQLVDGMEELVIVPHGLLHMVPFPALQSPDLMYLVNRFSIRYAPSIAIAQMASGDSAPLRGENAVLIAATKTPYTSLPELQAAAPEVDAVSAVLAGSRVLKGVDALRRHVLRLKGDIDILHLACHGEFDHDDPLLSMAFLVDGPLYGYEIERLAVQPSLVVLSACETGLHRRVAGDEAFGLVRAFLGCGSQAVVASLWKVADVSTSLLMTSFYRRLVNNRGQIAEALRGAQTEVLGSEKYSHPFYWAPYVMIGGQAKQVANV
jgi:CHAT domain-containing protein